jgi:hypothetical protein
MPFCRGIFPGQLDHCILHEVERFITVTHGDLREAQRAAFHTRQELVELPFALQRGHLFRLLAAARYRKNADARAHPPVLASLGHCRSIANSS